MQSSLPVDDTGTGIFRARAARFVQRLLGHAEFALSVVVGQTQKVVLTVGGEEHSTRSAHNVLDQLQQSGAAMHVFLLVNNGVRATVAVQRPGALLDENHNLGEVLGDGLKQSGGRREELVATSGVVASLQELAEELMHQYIITYTLADGVKPSNKIAVSVNRPGVSVRAPTRIPDR